MMFGSQQFSPDWVYFTSHLKHTRPQPVREHLNLENSVCRLWIDNMLDDSSEEEEKEGLESNFHTDSRAYPETPSQLAPSADQGMILTPRHSEGGKLLPRLARFPGDLPTAGSHCFCSQKYCTCSVCKDFVSQLWVSAAAS